jgi:hypothetical protein
MSARQAVLGKQSSALRARINDDLRATTSRANKLQATAAHDAKSATAAIMRTVTSGQAMTHEQAIEAANAKLKAKTKSKTKHGKHGKSSESAAAAKRAGLAAASKVKASASSPARGKVHSAAKSAHYSKSSATRASSSSKKTAVSKKSPVARGAALSQTTTSESNDAWFGAPHTDDCVAAAIANHALYVDGYRATREQFNELTDLLGYEPTIERGLEIAAAMARRGAWPAMPRFAPWLGLPIAGMIVGYEAMTDTGRRPHAALLVDDAMVVSWGDEMPLDTEIEEAFVIRWRSNTSSVAQTP